MEVKRLLDMRPGKNGKYKHRWALFICPYCLLEVAREKASGTRDKSCGCMRFELIARKNRTHNESNSPLYRTWKNMKARCYWNKHQYFYLYGGKGITICDEWVHDFISFKQWAESNGFIEGLTIDRIDSHKGYSPDNCQWLTPSAHSKKDCTGLRGTKWTIEQRQRMSIQRKGLKFPNRKRVIQSPEHTEKIRSGLIKYWNDKKSNRTAP